MGRLAELIRRVAAQQTVYLYDTFTGANGTLVGSRSPDVGGPYTSIINTATIQSNQATSPTGYAEYQFPSSSTDLQITVDVTYHGSGNDETYLKFWIVDSANYWALYIRPAYSIFRIIRFVGGTPTVMASGSASAAVGVPFQLKLTVSGDSITGTTYGGATISHTAVGANKSATAGFRLFASTLDNLRASPVGA